LKGEGKFETSVSFVSVPVVSISGFKVGCTIFGVPDLAFFTEGFLGGKYFPSSLVTAPRRSFEGATVLLGSWLWVTLFKAGLQLRTAIWKEVRGWVWGFPNPGLK
jgi:hypothetical protein